MKEYYVTTPLTEQFVSQLRAGDKVYLSSKIYTARDAAHLQMIKEYEQSGSTPFPLTGNVIYYVGPTPTKPGEVIGSCGPTTSYRMDPYHRFFAEKGIKMTIGKGDRSDAVVDQLIANNCVYAIAIGGAAAYYTQFVTASKIIAYDYLLSEAIHELEVKDFPVYIAIDALGNKIFK